MEGKDMVLFVVFILISTALITYMPPEIYSSGYQSPHYFIPEEFDAWNIVGYEYYIEDIVNTGEMTVYDFTSYFNETLRVRAKWKYGLMSYDDTIIIETVTSQFLFGYIVAPLEPVITKQMLILNWDEYINMSLIIVKDYKNSFEVYFEDTNTSRNNIGSSWNDGSMNCTIAVPKGYINYEQQTLGAREIIFCLLTFRLSEVYSTVNPLLGFTLACLIYVPVAFIFYYIIVHLLHGGS